MTTNYREILRLKSLGLNKTDIARSVQCARNTVSKVLERAEACGIHWPLPEGMSDRELAEKLFPGAPGKAAFKMPDYAHVHREMQRHGVTLTLLWMEYCDQCRAEGLIPYQSTQFNKYYSDYLNRINATMHLNHKPGDIMQVDWAGDTAAVVDTDTGEIIPAYVFVATLPYSGYSYVEAFFSMDQGAWTQAHVNAYRYFGGVTRMIQCDNLKTGVEKHSRNEVVLNKAYHELAEHYETAIVPARVRAPRDKAAVEGTVGILSTYILAALRNRQFLSLSELNEAIQERLESFNHKPFQKREGSRASAFAEELPFLRPLPPQPYELSVWKVASVGPNYHIAVRQFLSVKYIRLPDLLVEFSIARGNGTIRKLMAQYKKYSLLIIDEWLLYPLKESECRDLLEIMKSRYKRASTILCSPFDIPGWRDKLADPILADAICDRIVHDSYTIIIGGQESMRKRKGLKDT